MASARRQIHKMFDIKSYFYSKSHQCLSNESYNNKEEKSKRCFYTSLIPEKTKYHTSAHGGEILSLQWYFCNKEYNSEMLLTGGSDGYINIWSVEDGDIIMKKNIHSGNKGITSFDVDNNYLIASSQDNSFRMYTLNDSKLHRTLTGHKGTVMSVKFCYNPNKVCSGSIDRTLKLWDIRKYSLINNYDVKSIVYDLVTWDDGNIIISGHHDKHLRFVDIRSNNIEKNIILDGKIISLDVSSCGYYLLVSIRDENKLVTIDLRTNNLVNVFTNEHFKFTSDSMKSCFSPDNHYIISGSGNSWIYIWNAKTAELVRILKNGHNSTVICCKWNMHGNVIASCDRNKLLTIWK